jgi:hypothetical protein
VNRHLWCDRDGREIGWHGDLDHGVAHIAHFCTSYANVCTITGPAIAVAGPASRGVRLFSIHASFQRADAIEHPHTRAYACYYASVLYALRSEPTIAQEHAERCLALSEEHGFRQWRGLSRAIRGTCVSVLDPSSDTLKDVMSALEEYRGAGYQLGITALYVLLCRALLLLRQPDATLEVIEQGLATAVHNTERISEAELYRLKARALLARGGPDASTPRGHCSIRLS